MEEFQGTVEQIVFYNPENGYTVFRFAAEGRETATVVGTFPPLSPGETLRLQGAWEMNPRFGRQFRTDSFAVTLPASVKGIEKFLASGLIRGIGPVLAKRIVDHFGAETMTVLNEDPERLREVPGIGRVKLREIRASWAEHREIRSLIIFLQEHNVSTNLATKIYRQYGEKSFHVLKSNPYQLCLDIWGVGFKTADQLALKLGLDPGSPDRVKAYILYLLEKDNEQGHVHSLRSEVQAACRKDLETDDVKFGTVLDALAGGQQVVREPIPGDEALYLPFFRQAEEAVARDIHHLARFACQPPDFDLGEAVAEAEKNLGLTLSSAQRTAVRRSFEKKLLVITGGPGTGKTTIVRAVVDIFEKWGKEVILAAPTGRAAKRLSETTGRDARTIHRVLEFTPKRGTFKRDERHPLRGEALILDEVSMVDLPLMFNLLKAVPPWMRLVLVGDKDQLPSVGPGSLLGDIIASGIADVVRLDEIFRQERESLIVANAHRVNQGQNLVLPPRGDREADFYFLRQENEAKVCSTILSLCQFGVPRRLGVSPLTTQIQVISPMYKGLAGVDNLNQALQKRLNPSREGLPVGNREFRVRDKVMQVRNDYEKEVFNGDIGQLVKIDPLEREVTVNFAPREVVYEFGELDEIALAYAITIHKSQGSEFPAVVIPLAKQHYLLLQRNLVYTGVTRGKQLVVLVGQKEALALAVRNNRTKQRFSGLLARLKA